MKEKGYIYILSNPYYHDKDGKAIYKVGITQDLTERMSRLYNSAVPEEFKVEHAVEVEDYETKEKAIHNLLSDYRINDSREFFKLTPGMLDALKELCGNNNTEVMEDLHAMSDNYFDTASATESNTLFEVKGKLKVTRPDKTIICCKTAQDTYLTFINEIGCVNVKKLNLTTKTREHNVRNIILNKEEYDKIPGFDVAKQRNYYAPVGEWYVMKNFSNEQKMDYMKKINSYIKGGYSITLW